MTTSANKLPTIKPDDLVRTPSGQTGKVTDILPDGRREVKLLNGDLVALLPHQLYLVRSAPPLRWPFAQCVRSTVWFKKRR